MKKKKNPAKRNYVEDTRRLVSSARVEWYISEELIAQWHTVEARKPGGVIRYPDAVIEGILLLREYFQLALRQTQGFAASILGRLLGDDKTVPHYSTLCRRMQKLTITLAGKRRKLLQVREEVRRTGNNEGLVIAVDATGLSIYRQGTWNANKHQRKTRKPGEAWRKLHICMDTNSGDILTAAYSAASRNDGEYFPDLVTRAANDLPTDITIKAGSGDKAYDTANCCQALQAIGAHERIDLRRDAVPTCHAKQYQPKHRRQAFKNRDWQLLYLRHNAINGNTDLARKTLKRHIGYHQRSLVETAPSLLTFPLRYRLRSRSTQGFPYKTCHRHVLLNEKLACQSPHQLLPPRQT